MKKLLIFSLLLCCGCIITSTQQREANESVQQYTNDLFDHPKYLVPVSFSALEKRRYLTPLDSSLNNAHIKDNELKKMEHYVDSENYQRPDRAPGNIRQLDSIKKGRLFYYVMD